jgi:hypothetical protein
MTNKFKVGDIVKLKKTCSKNNWYTEAYFKVTGVQTGDGNNVTVSPTVNGGDDRVWVGYLDLIETGFEKFYNEYA